MLFHLLTSIALAAALAAPSLPTGSVSLPPGLPVRMVTGPEGLLLGTDSGLYRFADGVWRLELARGGVRDLARGAQETWVATPAGLFVWPDGSGTPVPQSLGAGARVRAIALDRGHGWVATAVGLFMRPPGERVFQRETGLPPGPVASVRAAGGRIWIAREGELWQRGSEGAFAPVLRRLDPGRWELRDAHADDAGAWLLVPEGLWWVPDTGPPVFRHLGEHELHAIELANGDAWLATARGLLRVALAGLDSVLPQTVVSGRALALARADGRLWVATERAITEVVLRGTGSGSAPVALVAGGGDVVDLRTLHRAVLRTQGLTPARLEEVEARARTAAFLPELRLAFSARRDRGRDDDVDQAFTSGALRELRDHGSDRELSADVSLQLTWDLDELRDPTRALAVSRERRELIELRDQVLERVNRLYFERLRVIARLETAAGPERAELVLRARELAAHLDAWTGGLFSRLDPSSPRSPRSQP